MMWAAACLSLASFGWGLHLGWSRRESSSEIVHLPTLEERLFHARNLSMRLGELAEHQRKCSAEQEALTQLNDMKLGVEWMLGEVERNMVPPHSESQKEEVERLVAATGKCLRSLLHIGRHPYQSKEDALSSIEPLKHTLDMLKGTNKTKSTKIDFEVLDKKTNTVFLVNQIFNQYIAKNHPACVDATR